MVRVLSAADVQRSLSMSRAIAVMREAFQDHARGLAPPPMRLDHYADDGEFHIKTGAFRRYFAVKANSGFFANPPALPAIQGGILLFDQLDGQLLAVVHSPTVTALRTAATSALAAQALARPDSDRLTIIGTGVQAWMHARAMREVLPLTRIQIYGRDQDKARRLAARVQAELGVHTTAIDTPAEARDSDVVATCTAAGEPLLGPGDVTAGAFIAAVGADGPVKRELDTALVASAAVITDVTAQCLTAGELHHAVAAGLMTEAHVRGELGAILLSPERGRRSPGEVVLFDSTGTGFQDAAAAAAVYQDSADPADRLVTAD
ncbi:ornithine cyclodeaminase family protein [Nonomuraea sp. NPDC000554]|uniref:ornithine cyclodeaminase family protein n=1 Tax=Nonomuraea sp. NPDC000554 TaxID=3154259 RepID=UPI00332AE667